METIFIYLIKVNALIAVFYLCYHFLVEKETFFNSNRWFLLLGLCTSTALPLFFIQKIVYIVKKPIVFDAITNTVNPAIVNQPTTIISDQAIQWDQVFLIAYSAICLVFMIKFLLDLWSLFQLLRQKEIEIIKPFALVDVNENITPFSFFKYIVFNSSLYSQIELDNILNHEKVHSREKHSFDVLIAKVFCVLFWFNPFVWLYKKAILQNLEYIADKKAMQHIEDKKAYQMTLLKVVTDHNYLSITNSFYQSLIKKRIVMLNKNQSKRYNIWKYVVIIPALVAFIIFFQVNVIAQEKEDNQINSLHSNLTANEVGNDPIVITKNTSDKKLKSIAYEVKTNHNIDLKFKHVKRNKREEIISIHAFWNDHKGTNGNHIVESDKAIKPFTFFIKTDRKGNTNISFSSDEADNTIELADENNSDESDNINNDSADGSDMPTPPTPPTPPTSPYMKNMPTPPTPPNFPPIPNIKVPKDPNDTKAWKKYEAAMEKFGQEWENSPEIKKFQDEMEAYGKEMEKHQPDMTAFEKEMEKFEARMEKFQEEMSAYQEAIQDKNQDRQEALQDATQARREALQEAAEARKEALLDAEKARLEAAEARREAKRAQEKRVRNN